MFFFKKKTAYEMRISDWSSAVCSSDLSTPRLHRRWHRGGPPPQRGVQPPQTKALTLALTPTVPAVFTGWIPPNPRATHPLRLSQTAHLHCSRGYFAATATAPASETAAAAATPIS